MRLTELIRQTAILETTGLSKEEAIAHLLLYLADAELIPLSLVPELLQTVKRREGLGSTGIGQGLAVPHAIHASLKEPIGILALCDPPVEFDSLDGEPVDILTLIVGSSSSARVRLQGLDSLFQAFREESFQTEIRAATSSNQIRQVIYNWDRLPKPHSDPPKKEAPNWPSWTTRKARFFACACARWDWENIKSESQRAGIELVERVLDHQASESDLIRFRQNLPPPTNDTRDALVCAALRMNPLAVLGQTLILAPQQGMPIAEQAALLQDIWGPAPSSWPAPDASWQTWKDQTIPRIATGIYETGDFASLPILADALEDSGCTTAELLDHLRGPGPHIHGCWVLDLLLGEKEHRGHGSE